LERSGRFAAVVRLTPRRGTAVRRPVVLKADPSKPRFLDAGLSVRVKKDAVALRVRCAKRCAGAVVLTAAGRRYGVGELRKGTVRIELSRRVRGAMPAVVTAAKKRVDVTLTSGGNR
jgi:hypothetical protein